VIKTYGLTHTALQVADLDRSLRFYQALVGAEVKHRSETGLDFTTPGCHDVVTLQRATTEQTGDMGQLGHIGFRLQSADDVTDLAAAVTEAGGTVGETGHFAPGQPYVFAKDPDGYVIELWYEP
jgi:catechol 2,3-dioxygenase-like lactoylglutathione lyase family enzyme